MSRHISVSHETYQELRRKLLDAGMSFAVNDNEEKLEISGDGIVINLDDSRQEMVFGVSRN